MTLNTPVSEMMTRNVISVKPSQKLQDVKNLFRESGFHYNIPVIENDQLKGMVVLTDFMFTLKNVSGVHANSDYGDLTISDIMREKVQIITPRTTVREAARLFADGEQHSVMVAEEGRLQGIVSSADILRWMLNAQS